MPASGRWVQSTNTGNATCFGPPHCGSNATCHGPASSASGRRASGAGAGRPDGRSRKTTKVEPNDGSTSGIVVRPFVTRGATTRRAQPVTASHSSTCVAWQRKVASMATGSLPRLATK